MTHADEAGSTREPALYQALVCTPVAPMHAEPRIASPMVSQRLGGHAVDVLDREGEWLRGRGADEYQGWMHQGFLMRLHEPYDEAGVRISLGCTVERPRQGTRALPLLARLAPDDAVVSGAAVSDAERGRLYPLSAAAVAETARVRFAGTSYLWGGVTPWGADCSGLVQTSFGLHGLHLPRDAWQQAECGRDAGQDVAAYAAGDLLFFSDRPDRRITHVGIALGESRMVHLALNRGGYRVEQLDGSDPFVGKLRERFIVARRLLP